jgi:pimeloyl-ACP methyl ester carboxylesterase
MEFSPPIDQRHALFEHESGATHYQVIGREDRPLVVLMPGATLPLAVWEPLLPPLLALGYRVLRYDLPGRGFSTPLGIAPGLISDVTQLRELLDGLQLGGPVHLVGLASGALSACDFALAHRARVARAVLIAPDGVDTQFTLKERLFMAPGLGELLLAVFGRPLLLARAKRYSQREEVRAFVRDLLRFALRNPHFRKELLSYVRALPLADGEAHYAALARGGVPVCVLWGGGDQITPPHAADRLRELFGPESTHVLGSIGHLPMVEAPHEAARVIDAHLRRA